MDYKKLLIALGFSPKENAVDVFSKKYPQADNYCLEVDFQKQTIHYGDKIQSNNKTTQNFSQPENFVVLECVNRLLEKGYKPENIILEKTFPLGHNSGRLDILVAHENETSFLMIECKTYGKEFDKAFNKLKKDGGQLFTYFQQDKSANVLALYTSKLENGKIIYENKIINITEEYQQANNVKDFYNKWDKQIFEKGIFEEECKPYNFQPKKFTKGDLKELTEEKGKKLFHGFATILRKHSVSDKPNAFNVIFNLFLAKLYDEQKRDDVELEFQWKNDDNSVDFQVRLYNLHKEGLLAFLKKEIEGIEENFEAKKTIEEQRNAKKKFLKINKHFDIKNVMNDDDFDQNHRVLKEVVQLIEKYRIRYPRKQKYLSEFFELLLTTGLKQEVGQYFTPPPITKFIVKSLPLHKMIEQEVNKAEPKLPAVIDYAVGSGHFITEIMEEYQDIIKDIDAKKVKYLSAENEIISWQVNPYSWASKYVYGIEKDYRLVKVAKVGCYFYGDGLAQIIHGDGLDSLTNPPKSYVGLLEQNTNTENSAKNEFSVVVANPPYSVKYCKEDLEYIGSEKDFTLYPYLTYDSNEIECLFVERTKHLLKDDGVAGIILPNSILNGTSEIYTKTREIILQNFEVIAITELSSNTFMATGTNTIVLFLRRRKNSDSTQLKEFVEKFFIDFQDNNPPKPFNTIDLEKPFTKYVNHVWESVNLVDYISLVKNTPNKNIQNHVFYKTYRKSVEIKIESEISKAQKSRKTQLSDDDVQKIKDRIEREYFNNFIETEKEKLLYFILAYNQKVVLVNTGKGNEEKRFLGYEFSNAKGNEGIHPIQRGKSVDDCTKLYNENDFEDKTKASFYVYKAFSLKENEQYPEIDESLQNNISRVHLVDMLTFDRVGFAKNISTAVKKKVKIESKWNIVKIGQVSTTQYGFTDKASDNGEIRYLRITDLNDDGSINLDNEKKFINPNEETIQQFLLKNNDIVIARSGSVGKSAIFKKDKYEDMIFASYLIRLQVIESKILPDYLFYFTKTQMYWNQVEVNSIVVTQPNLNAEKIKDFQIPLPPKEIQEKIVLEIEMLEKKEKEAKINIEKGEEQIENICLQMYSKYDKEKLSQLAKTNPSKKEITDLDINTLISFVDMPSVSNNGYIANKIDKPYSEIKKGSYTYFREGDIIIAKITPCMENGKCALATNLTNGLALGSSEFHVFRTDNDKINTKYLFTLLNRKSVRVEAEKSMTGASGHRRVPIAFYENLEIPVPPLSEQQKIVSEIEKIETQIAELEQQLAEAPKEKEAVLKKHL